MRCSCAGIGNAALRHQHTICGTLPAEDPPLGLPQSMAQGWRCRLHTKVNKVKKRWQVDTQYIKVLMFQLRIKVK